MKINSIKVKVLVLVTISIVLSFIALGFYNAKNNYSSHYNLIKQKELNLAKSTSKFINSYIQSKIDIVQAAAKEIAPLDLSIENQEIVDKLRLGKEAGSFEGFYLGIAKNGNFLQYNGTSRTPQTVKYDARARPWFKNAVKLDGPAISEPYIDFTSKKMVISVSTPLKKNGKVIGAIGSDIFIDTIVDSILNIKLDGDGSAYLLNDKQTIIIHKDEELFGKEDTLYSQIKTKQKDSFGEVIENNNTELVAYSTINTTNWKLMIKINKDSIFEEINKQILQEIVLYLVLLFLILLFILLSLIRIFAPLKTLEDGLNFFFKYLKGKEKEIHTININSNDEFGNMAKVINQEIKIISEGIEQDRDLINNVKEVVSEVNEGKLDVKVNKTTSNKSLNELKDILNEMITTISHNVNDDINPILIKLQEYSKFNFVNNIPNANGNIAKGLNDLSNIINEMLQENKSNGINLDKSSKILLENVDILNKASNDTAVSLEETAAALEEITSTVVNNTQRISTMASHSNALSTSIEEGQKLASYTVESMDTINEQTQSIAAAITVIDQIAFQTNILSLNAAVEAATAGEAGKGFAVVAQEVRNLASRSAEAAKEIKNLVENATTKTNGGKKIADDMIKGYIRLKENISKTTDLIEDISSSSKEQRTGIEQINDVITRLDRQTQNNASVATQTYNIAIDTSQIAEKILETVDTKKFRDS